MAGEDRDALGRLVTQLTENIGSGEVLTLRRIPEGVLVNRRNDAGSVARIVSQQKLESFWYTFLRAEEIAEMLEQTALVLRAGDV